MTTLHGIVRRRYPGATLVSWSYAGDASICIDDHLFTHDES